MGDNLNDGQVKNLGSETETLLSDCVNRNPAVRVSKAEADIQHQTTQLSRGTSVLLLRVCWMCVNVCVRGHHSVVLWVTVFVSVNSNAVLGVQ